MFFIQRRPFRKLLHSHPRNFPVLFSISPYRTLTVSLPSYHPVSPNSIDPSSLECYLNGTYLPLKDAKISVEDRGFLFSDGVYEVTKVYSASTLSSNSPYIFTEREHLQRLRTGLTQLHFTEHQIHTILPIVTTVGRELLQRNNLGMEQDAIIYTQITRGISSPRMHAFPDPVTVSPTVFLSAKPFTNPSPSVLQTGVRAVTQIDTRWARCDIKSIALLPNVLANDYAKRSSAHECLYLRPYQQYYTLAEASHSNVFGVYKWVRRSTPTQAKTITPSAANPFKDYVLVTHPLSKNILPGITRNKIVERAHELGIRVKEGYVIYRQRKNNQPILDDERYVLQECFVTATTTEIMPIVQIDEDKIGTGKVGPITTALRDTWMKWVKEEHDDRTMKNNAPVSSASPGLSK